MDLNNIKFDVNTPKCMFCGKEFIPHKDSNGKRIKYEWVGNCEHFPKGYIICIG